jgi:hypothetical protein
MPKCLKRYLDKSKAMRYRNRQRALNYEIGNFSDEMRLGYDWWECDRILDHSIPDRNLARDLRRSVRTIQVKRSLLKRAVGQR